MIGERRILVVAGAALALCACDAVRSSDDAVTVADSAGVLLVEFHQPPMDTLRLNAPTVRIGDPGADAAEHEAFAYVSDVGLLDDGSVIVVDNRGGRVARFAPDGEWLGDAGAHGSGPGEHRGPLRVLELEGGGFAVWDALQSRLIEYDGHGMARTTRFMPDLPTDGHVRPWHNGFLVERESGQLNDPEPARAALVRHDPSGAPGDTMAGPYAVPEYGWRVVDQSTGRGHMVNPPAFEVRPPWVTAGDTLWVGHPLHGSIEARVGLGGRLHARVRSHTMARPATDADRQAYIDAFVERFGMSPEDADRSFSETVFADTVPAFSDLLRDDEGRLWIGEFDAGSPLAGYVGTGWTVLRPDSRKVEIVRFPAGFRLLRLGSGRAVGVTTTDLGTQVVDVFDLR